MRRKALFTICLVLSFSIVLSGSTARVALAAALLAGDPESGATDPSEPTFDLISTPVGRDGITFNMSKSIYRLGEAVEFTLANHSESTITLSRGAPWVIKSADGTVVLDPISIMVIVELNPGDAMTWTWNQRDDSGVQVGPGIYSITIETSSGELSAPFCITGLKSEKDHQNPDPQMPERNPFKDVTGEHPWGDPHILALYERGIVRGKSADTFDPDGTLTRAEFLAMLLRACGVDVSSVTSETDHWAGPYIDAAATLRIIRPEEYPAGFDPDAPITRLEISVMAVRALGLENEVSGETGTQLEFADSEDISEAYRGYVAKAIEWGVLRGYSDSTLRPGNQATRREAAVIIYRLMPLN